MDTYYALSISCTCTKAYTNTHTQSLYVALLCSYAGLEFIILLPQSSKYLDWRCLLSPRTLYLLPLAAQLWLTLNDVSLSLLIHFSESQRILATNIHILKHWLKFWKWNNENYLSLFQADESYGLSFGLNSMNKRHLFLWGSLRILLWVATQVKSLHPAVQEAHLLCLLLSSFRFSTLLSCLVCSDATNNHVPC